MGSLQRAWIVTLKERYPAIIVTYKEATITSNEYQQPKLVQQNIKLAVPVEVENNRFLAVRKNDETL